MRPAQIGMDTGVQVQTFIVTTRLGSQRTTRHSSHFRRQLPACDAPCGIGRIGDAAVKHLVGRAQAETQTIRLVDLVGGGKVDRTGLAGIPCQAAPDGSLVFVAQFFGGVAVVLPGAALFCNGGQTAQQVRSQLARDIAFEFVIVIAAVFGSETGTAIYCRGIGDDVDSTAGGVAAIKRALRPAQNLEAGNVEHRALCGDRIGVRDFIHIDADSRGIVGRILTCADATDAELGLAAAELAVDFHVRDDIFNVIDDRDAFFVQVLAADDRQGDTHILRGLFAALGGDDDVGYARHLLCVCGQVFGEGVSVGDTGCE